LGLLRPADRPAPKEEKPLFPPANPVLRRRLAQIAKEGGLPTGDYERVISEEELAQAQQDKQLALQILAQGGDERQAVRLLTQAVSILPDPHSLVRLAEIEVANPLLRQRALAHLKQALEMEPRFTPAWLALANYWGLRGDVGKQKRCLENILKYDPQNREVREALLHLVG
jgi:tetratricopeptide (TPR) repeat protein